MIPSATRLLGSPKKDRRGEILSAPGGWTFWKYRPGAKPTDFLAHNTTRMTAFTGRESRNADVKLVGGAYDYFKDGGQYGGFHFIKLKAGTDWYFPNLVDVFHGADDVAPVDATHKMFVPGSEGYPDTEAYVRLDKDSNPSLKLLSEPDPDVVPSPSTTLEVWHDGAFVTKSASEMEAHIKEVDTARGSSNVSRCVSAMLRGGKYTLKYDNAGKTGDILHASKGKRGDSGTCTVFYVHFENSIRLVGFGHHTGNTSYRVTWTEPKIQNGAVVDGPAVLKTSINL